MSWTNLCIEAFCFGDTDAHGNYPCGTDYPTHLCLSNGHCPYLGYCETTERSVAEFTPLRFIIKDRLGIWGDDLYWKLRWWFWDSLWFNRRKTNEFFASIPTTEAYPIGCELEEEQSENKAKFLIWFKQAKKEDIK